MKSKLLLSLLFVSGVTACSSAKEPQPQPQPITIKWEAPPVAKVETKPVVEKPIYQLRNYEGPEAMENSEVIAFSKQCLTVQLRPKINYLTIRTDSGSLKVPVSVVCENW